MAILDDQTAQGGDTFGTSRTVSFSSAPGAADCIVIWFWKENTAAITKPSGFTELKVGSGGAKEYDVFIAYNETGNSYVFSWTGGIISGWNAITFSGVDATTQVDVSNAAFDTSSFSPLTVSGLTTVTDKALHLMCGGNSSTNDGGVETGYTRFFQNERPTVWTKEIDPAAVVSDNEVDLGTEFECAGYSFALKPAVTESAVITGTAVPDLSEAEAVAGGETVIITLGGGAQWIASLKEAA